MPKLTPATHNWAAERAFIQRLQSALLVRQMTRADLGRMVGAQPATVSEWFNRFTVPKGQFLLKMPDALQVDGHWLLTGEGAMDHRARKNGDHERFRVAVESLVRIQEAVEREARTITQRLEGKRTGKTSRTERRRGFERRLRKGTGAKGRPRTGERRQHQP